jgi:hypothetical protein
MDRADETQLRDRARRAYERGRLRAAVLGAWPVVALASVCLVLGARWWIVLAVASLHAALVVVFLQRGRAAGRAVTTGWLAGSLPLVVSLMGCRVPHACGGGSCVAWCLPGCLAASLVAGVVIVRRALDRRAEARETAFAAAVVAALTGGMGCTMLGLGGAIAILAGLAIVTAPALLITARR